MPLEEIGRAHARTNGNIDIAYTVPGQGMPVAIANIYTQPFEEVVDKYLAYVWERLIEPNRGDLEEIVRTNGILFET